MSKMNNLERPQGGSEDVEDDVTPAPLAHGQSPFGQLVRRVAATSLIYTLGTFGLRFASFLLIPLYWRFLDPADYGLLAVTEIFKTFLSVFLGLGIADSITRFFHAWPETERRERLGSIWILDWGSSLLVGLPIVALSAPLTGRLIVQVPFDPYLKLAALTAICLSFSITPLMTLRIQEQARLYVGCSALSFGLQTILSICLVVAQRQGALGILEAQFWAALLMIPVFTVIMWPRARLVFKFGYVTEAIKYSLPLVPSGLVEAIISTTDRFLLEKQISLSELGLYSAGDSLATSVRFFGQSLKASWIPFTMQTANERTDAPTVIGRMATFFAAAIILAAMTLAVLSRDLVAVIGVAKYQPVAQLVPLFAVPYLILCLGTVFSGGYAIAKQTRYAPLITLSHLIVSLVGNLALIPVYGMYGAILASALGWSTRVTLGFIISQRFYWIRFEWQRIGLLLGAALATFFIGVLLPIQPSWWGLCVRAGVVAGFMAVAGYFLLGKQAFRVLKTYRRIDPADSLRQGD